VHSYNTGKQLYKDLDEAMSKAITEAKKELQTILKNAEDVTTSFKKDISEVITSAKVFFLLSSLFF